MSERQDDARDYALPTTDHERRLASHSVSIATNKSFSSPGASRAGSGRISSL